MFPWSRKSVAAELVGHNVTAHVIGVDPCRQMASLVRGCPVPDGVLIAEVAFLRASAVCCAIDQRLSGDKAERMKAATRRVVLDAFAGEEANSPPAVLAHYHNRRLAEIAATAMAAYEKQGDIPILTCPIFCRRVRAPGMTNYEITPLIDDLVEWCKESLSTIRVR